MSVTLHEYREMKTLKEGKFTLSKFWYDRSDELSGIYDSFKIKTSFLCKKRKIS